MKFSVLFLPILLNKLRKQVNNACSDLLKKHNLSQIHLLYMMALYEYPEGLTLKELTNLLGFDKANTTRAVSQLSQKGYTIKEAQGDLEHKFKVILSSNGQIVATEIWEHANKQNLDIISLFTAEELNVLRRVGEKVWNSLSQTQEENETSFTDIKPL